MSTTDQSPIAVDATDPTETTQLRKSFQEDITRRWRTAERDIEDWFEELQFPTSYQQLLLRYRTAFWRMAESTVLEPIPDARINRGQHWTGMRVRTAYQHGLELARQDLRAVGTPAFRVQRATRFHAEPHQDRVGVRYQSAFSTLEDHVREGISETRPIVERGIDGRNGGEWFADEVVAALESTVLNYGKSHANTAVVRAVNDALLVAFQQAGVSDVAAVPESRGSANRTNYIRFNAEGDPETYAEVVAEADSGLPDPDDPREPDDVMFVTAGDEKVCEQCRGLEGTTVAIAAVLSHDHEFIPVHPNCRCRWLPVPP